MDQINLTVIGIGSIRDGAPVLAGLAQYFGERPMTIRLYDYDAERLQLFYLLGRSFFQEAKSNHELEWVDSIEDALKDANAVVFCPSQNYLDKYGHELPNPGKARDRLLQDVKRLIHDDCPILTLRAEVPFPNAKNLEGWPEDLSPELEAGMPHQILRWVHMDDDPQEYMEIHKKSEFSEWLEEICSFLRTV
jgi:hypothetical protein